MVKNIRENDFISMIINYFYDKYSIIIFNVQIGINNKNNMTPDNINLIYDVYCNTSKKNTFISFLKLLNINDIEKIIFHYFDEGIIISDCKIFVNKSGVFDKISFNIIEKNKQKVIGGNYGK